MTNYQGPATAFSPNAQPIEKLDRDRADVLDIHSIFYTIQGEGPFCGVPAVFIRLAGCNLQCPWCDTDYTTGRERWTTYRVVDTVRRLAPAGTLVVITGGEPFRQDLTDLLIDLLSKRYYVQIETNGTLPPPNLPAAMYSVNPQDKRGVYVVCSPKTGAVQAAVHGVACCYKYVLDVDSIDPEDGLPLQALGHAAKPRLARPLAGTAKPVYLQPADHKDALRNQRNMDAVVASAMKHGYTVQVQIHKILGME